MPKNTLIINTIIEINLCIHGMSMHHGCTFEYFYPLKGLFGMDISMNMAWILQPGIWPE